LNYNATSGEVTYVTSSRSTKNTIQSLATDTSSIYQLAPKTFIYNSDTQLTRHVGYIAEEVHEVDPVFATYDSPDGPPLAISFDTIQVYMLEEMKKLRDRIAVLEAAATPASQ